jgi:hypothetical protein
MQLAPLRRGGGRQFRGGRGRAVQIDSLKNPF